MPHIIMHINYLDQGQTLEEACRKAAAWGFDGIEFWRQRPGVQETAEQYLDTVARAVDSAGLRDVHFGVPGANLSAPDPALRAREIEDLVRFYRLAAARFRLTVCNTVAGFIFSPDKSIPGSDYGRHGSAVAGEEHWSWAIEGLRRLGDAAGELGFRLALETHMLLLHDLPAVTQTLVQRIGRAAVGVNLDYGNAVYFRPAPPLKDSIAGIGKSLYYVHLKNSIGAGGARFHASLAAGEINHREYLRLLKESGYNGPLCIEAPRPGDREWFARQDLEYLKWVLADLGWDQ